MKWPEKATVEKKKVDEWLPQAQDRGSEKCQLKVQGFFGVTEMF